jgi:hypothetical protein
VLGLTLEHEQPELSAKHYKALAEGPLAKTALGKLATHGSGRAPSKPPKRGAR